MAFVLPEIILKDIEDVYIRENFKRISFFLQEFPLFRGNFYFFERSISGAVTNFKIAHGLDFVPTDVILTANSNPGSILFNTDKFDKTNIDVTTTGACDVRFFLGAYKEESSRTGR